MLKQSGYAEKTRSALKALNSQPALLGFKVRELAVGLRQA